MNRWYFHILLTSVSGHIWHNFFVSPLDHRLFGSDFSAEDLSDRGKLGSILQLPNESRVIFLSCCLTHCTQGTWSLLPALFSFSTSNHFLTDSIFQTILTESIFLIIFNRFFASDHSAVIPRN
jgi:hypothetical protein